MTKQRPHPVWDWPLRLFHWLLVASLAASWLTAEAGFDWTEQHFWLGYLALSLVLFRLIWGCIGSYHARYRHFLVSPKIALRYIGQLWSKQPNPQPGHSPIGGYASVLLLLLVAVQAITGLFISDDIFYAGPYNAVISSSTAGLLANIHHTNFQVMQAAVVLHVSVMLWYRWRKRQNLVAAMWHGGENGARPAVSLWRGLLAAAIAASTVSLLVWLAPPPSVPDFY